jgi:hypothetical protein
MKYSEFERRIRSSLSLPAVALVWPWHNEGLVVQPLIRWWDFLQRHQPRALKPTKRVRLSGPIQIPWAFGIALEAMFRGLVIIENLLKQVKPVSGILFHSDRFQPFCGS